jgi:hypothetical protein
MEQISNRFTGPILAIVIEGKFIVDPLQKQFKVYGRRDG